MQTIFYKYEDYILRTAEKNDLPALLNFQKLFHVHEESTSPGVFFYHIENDLFSTSDFEKIIARQEIAVAQKDDEIVAYSLIGNCSVTTCLQDHQRYIAHFRADDYLDAEERLAPRVAELFNPAYKTEELHRHLFSMLLYVCKNNYDALFCSVCMNADELLEKLKLGWKIVFDNGMYYFLHWAYKPEPANE